MTPELARKPPPGSRTPPHQGTSACHRSPTLPEYPYFEPPPVIPREMMMTPEFTPVKHRLFSDTEGSLLVRDDLLSFAPSLECPKTPPRPTVNVEPVGPRRLFADFDSDDDDDDSRPLTNPFLVQDEEDTTASRETPADDNPFWGRRKRVLLLNLDTHIEYINHTTGKRLTQPVAPAHRHLKPSALRFDNIPHEITDRYINHSGNHVINLKPKHSLGFRIHEDDDVRTSGDPSDELPTRSNNTRSRE